MLGSTWCCRVEITTDCLYTIPSKRGSLRPFADEFRSSIAIDASTVGDTTVTVAVHTIRNDEIEILDSLCRHADEVESGTVVHDGNDRTELGGFEPFATKAGDLDRNADARFFESVIGDHRTRIRSLRHVHRGNPSTHDIEAVHSALLVKDFLTNLHRRPLILVDGDETKGRSLQKALGGLGTEVPGLTHCVRSELYYPQSLLADIAAHYVAGRIDTTTTSHRDPPFRPSYAKRTQTNDWGRAYSGLETNDSTYSPAVGRRRRGNTPAERARCWFDGTVATGHGDGSPATDSVTPIANYLEKRGYELVASELSKL